MFAHVFPLQDIFHLWDKLLLGDSSFPLCVGLSILLQLRERLLSAEFNDCILLFSDLPAVDIERCVADSVRLFSITPPSLSWRKYGSAESAGPLTGGKKDPASDTRNGFSDVIIVNDHDPLEIDSITLKEQKAEKVPRIAGREVLEMLGLVKKRKKQRRKNLSGVPAKREEEERDDEDKQQHLSDYSLCANRTHCQVLVVDTRTPEEYKLGTLPDSLHLPAASSFVETAENENGAFNDPYAMGMGLPPPVELTAEAKDALSLRRKGKDLICVVGAGGERHKEAVTFAERLLRLNYSRVCLMHGGMEIFRPMAGMLCVPDT